MKRRIISSLCTLIFLSTVLILLGLTANGNKSYIKYMEFDIPINVLEKAMNLDIDSHNDESVKDVSWIDMLAYLATIYGGDFSKYKQADMEKIYSLLTSGQALSDITRGMKYFSYYKQAYTAVLGEFLGTYTEECEDETGKRVSNTTYGLKVYSPICNGYYYTHYDDFGVSRSYGYKREHLGHDLMASTGTPVIAVESGTVEALGWNQYGGWRIGIRSFDKKRYYYYAHLRQNRPYHCDLYEGKTVLAGDVIGYVGRTGYSPNENTNGIEVSHLHFGLQIIFDESQKEGNNEIWVNLYDITKLLNKHQSKVYRVNRTKEFYRKFSYSDPKLSQ